MMQFEWDRAKATSNVKKHGVTFKEAATVFEDSLAITFEDVEHSIDEQRFISVRTATARERKRHET